MNKSKNNYLCMYVFMYMYIDVYHKRLLLDGKSPSKTTISKSNLTWKIIIFSAYIYLCKIDYRNNVNKNLKYHNNKRNN